MIPATEQFWPSTGSGWIGIGLSVFTFLGVIIGGVVAYGKWLSRINGFGARVSKTETDLVEVRALQEEHTRQVDRLLDQHESLITQVAESKKRADQCSEEFEDHAVILGSKIDELKNQSSRTELSISQRLTAVETELKLARKT